MIVRIFSFCFFVDKMNPTRHIMKEKDSELAIFCSGKKQNGPNFGSPHYEEKKILNWPIFCSWKNNWTQLATLPMKIRNSELANFILFWK